MTISSRTPEGAPNRCPVCGNPLTIEHSLDTHDGCCPHCGSLVWLSSANPIEAAKGQIRAGVEHLRALAKTTTDRSELYSALASGLVEVLAAQSAAVWATSPSGLVCHGMAGLPCDEQSLRGAAHLQLLTRVADSGAPIILRPDEAPTIVNDDRYAIESLLIACPIRRRGESVAVVEVFQRPGARLGTQRGYLRFVAQMCELASESRVLDAA